MFSVDNMETTVNASSLNCIIWLVMKGTFKSLRASESFCGENDFGKFWIQGKRGHLLAQVA